MLAAQDADRPLDADDLEALGEALLRANPGLRAILFDLPHIAERAVSTWPRPVSKAVASRSAATSSTRSRPTATCT